MTHCIGNAILVSFVVLFEMQFWTLLYARKGWGSTRKGNLMQKGQILMTKTRQVFQSFFFYQAVIE